jgi:hypothetical protein
MKTKKDIIGKAISSDQHTTETLTGNGYFIQGSTGVGSNITTYSNITQITMPTLERPRFAYDDKPDFSDGEIVEVDLSYFGKLNKKGKQRIVEGVVVGKEIMGGYTMGGYNNWLIDLGDNIKSEVYPYSVMVIPTAAICKPELMEWEQKK